MTDKERQDWLNEMEYTINHGRDVLTLCAESLLELGMKTEPEKPLEQRDINVIFGLRDVLQLEADYFDKVLDNA